jgi:hypothetical protein
MTRRRRPWIAALLSFVLPGLGHLYVGYPAMAAVAYAAVFFSFAIMLAAWLLIPSAPLNILLGLAAFPTIYLVVPVHAWILAARRPPNFELRSYNRWYVYVGLYLLLGYVLLPHFQEELKPHVPRGRTSGRGVLWPLSRSKNLALPWLSESSAFLVTPSS